MKAVDGGVQWICQYSDADNLRILFEDWEDDGELTFRTWDEREHNSTRIILDVDQIIEMRDVLNGLLEGL